MLKLTKTNTLSAVALAMAAIATPSLAAAGTYGNSAYENCKRSDTESQVLGGVLGAVTGGVLGSQVAGNGARSEGSALGAVIGAVAGSQIANKDCKSRSTYRSGDYREPAPTYRNSGYSNSGYNTVYTAPRVTTVHHPVRQPTYRNSGYSNGYGYNQTSYRSRDSLNREIRETRYKLKELKRRSRYEPSYRLDRKIERVGNRLRRLKNERKYANDNRGYQREYNRRGYGYGNNGGHYHGSNICYTDH